MSGIGKQIWHVSPCDRNIISHRLENHFQPKKIVLNINNLDKEMGK